MAAAASLLRGTAFITGAASGIGHHAALSFARYGIQRLALADVNTKLLASTAKELRSQYRDLDILELQMDVRSSAEVRSGVAETVSRFGRLDVAVNNAGIGGSGAKTHEVPEDEWARVLDVDLHGVWRCQKEELGVMMEQEDRGRREGGRGAIVNVASMYGLIAPGNHMYHTAYAAAKHGVIGLTKGDGNTYAQHGIRINAICPGYVETPLIEKAMAMGPDSPLGMDIARTPAKRMAQMDEIGDCITFLASPLASFMQGAGLVADGGFTTQ